MKRLLGLCALAATAGMFVMGCGDDSATAPSSYVEVPPPLFGIATPANGAGQCMGDDAVTYSGLVSGLSQNSQPEDVNCTANDIEIADAVVTSVDGQAYDPNVDPPIVCAPGSNVTVGMTAILQSNANADREDIGVWIATDGGNALTGACNHYNLIPGESGTFNADADQCAGMAQGAMTSVPLGDLTFACEDPDGDGFLEVAGCLSWKIPGGDLVCSDNQDGSGAPNEPTDFRAATLLANKSKCNCNPSFLEIQVQGSLTLVKRIVNDDGGTATVSAFGITTNAGSPTFGAGVADGANTLKYTSNTLPVSPGTYTFSENDVAGYAEGSWSCSPATATGTAYNSGSVTIASGQAVTCTITNDDQQGSLTLVKRIVNDDGGTATVSDFGITTDAGSPTFGAGVADGANTLKYTSNTLAVDAGSYTFSENDIAGYSEGSWSCSPTTATTSTFNNGSVTVGNGVAVTCTITNDDQQGSLTLVKRIVNDDGGTATVSDFGITTDAGSPTFGAGVADGANTLKYTSNTLAVDAGSYTFAENDVSGYEEGTWSCSPTAATTSTFNDGSVTVGNGVAVTCTITNDDDIPPEPGNSVNVFMPDFTLTGGTTLSGDLTIQNVSSNIATVTQIVITAQFKASGPGGWSDVTVSGCTINPPLPNNIALGGTNAYTFSGCTVSPSVSDGQLRVEATVHLAGAPNKTFSVRRSEGV